MGVSGAAGTLPRLVIGRPDGRAWFGAGGEAYLQVLRVGSKGRDSLVVLPKGSMGAGRAKSPCEWLTGDTGLLASEGFNAVEKPMAGGDATGARSGSPCQDVRYYRTHLAVSAKLTVMVQVTSIWGSKFGSVFCVAVG